MVRRTTPNRKPRLGVAAVELAVLLIPLLFLWVCVIELGRMIQVDQVVTNATRDAARLAGQAFSIRADPAAPATNIYYSVVVMKIDTPKTDTTRLSIEDTIKGHLAAHRIILSGITIEFAFLTGDTSRAQPYMGTKVDNFRVRLTVPYTNYRWMSITGSMGQAVSCEVRWKMLVDDTFSINTTIPDWNGN